MKEPKNWALLVNPDFVQGRGQWSRENHCGYTMDFDEAGRFTEEEAKKHATALQGHKPKYTAIKVG